MPTQSMHFIQIKHYFKWDVRVMTIKQDGLNVLNYEGGKTDNLNIPFKNVISINYQFGSNNDVSLTWNKQSTSGYKQTTWQLFSHDRDLFLSEYYRYYDRWRRQQPQYLQSIAAHQQIACCLLHDNWLIEEIKINVKTSEIELLSQGEVVDRYSKYKTMVEKCIELREEDVLDKSMVIPFVDIGLIVEYKNALEFIYKSSHIKTTLFFMEGSPNKLVQLIHKKENEVLGFVNRVEDKSTQELEEPQYTRFALNQDFEVDKTKHVFEQTRTQRWEYPQFQFQMFGWRTLLGGRYQRRVLLVFDDKFLIEYDDQISKGQVLMTILNRYPLKSITHIVRTDFMEAMLTVKLIFKDRSSLQYTFEPFQRDIFVTSLYHLLDCNQIEGQSRLDSSFQVMKNDSFTQVAMSSTDPDFSRKVYGWQDSIVSPAFERYILQQFCSSKDDWSFFENAISLRLNLQLRDFQDNQIVPLVCLTQMADRIFMQYRQMAPAYESYLRCHRVQRTLKSHIHEQQTEQLQTLKKDFVAHFQSKVQQDELSESFVNLSVSHNPIWKALQISLVCTYTSFEDNQDDVEGQYDRKRDEMIRLSEQVEPHDLDHEQVQLLILKIEEIIVLLIKLIDAPALYHEILTSKQHGDLFSRVINYVGDIGCNCPHPLLNLLSNLFLSKMCYNWVAQGQGSEVKSKLLRENYMTKLIHSLSSFTLVNDSDSFQIRVSNVVRQSIVIHMDNSKRNQRNVLLYAKSLPRSFLREELYTLHIIGFLKIIEAFTSPGCRDSTHHNDQKLLLQYLQTPYFIAVMNKLLHYKSLNIQFRTTIILANILDLLRIETLDPYYKSEKLKAIPCSAMLMFSRNYELIQTLLLKRSTTILHLLNQLSNCTKLQNIINIWTLSLIFKGNSLTSGLVARTYPLGLFYHISKHYFTQNQLEDYDQYSTVSHKLATWEYSEWEIFFSQLKVDYYLPEVVWSECERVMVHQKLSTYDSNFTYSQGVFLKQSQVDLILREDRQEENFLQGIENALFCQSWNISQYVVNVTSLNDLWLIGSYYLRVLLNSEELIQSIPDSKLKPFFQSLFIAYLTPTSLDQHITVTKAFVLLYRLHSSITLDLPEQFIRTIVKNGINYLSQMKNDTNFQVVHVHAEAMYVIANVYENELQKNHDELKIVWEIYQRNVQVLLLEGALDFMTEIFARSVYEESLDETTSSLLQIPIFRQQQSQQFKNSNWNKLKILLLDLLRVTLLCCHTNTQLEPYPLVKQILLLNNKGIRIHIILNQLIHQEEVTHKVKQMIIQIISKQLNDTQAILALSRIPIFVEALTLQLMSHDMTLIHGVITIFKNLYDVFLQNAPKQTIDRLINYLNIGMFIRKLPYDEERETINYLPYLRLIPFQLARKLIHQMPIDQSQDIFQFHESYDLLWNQELAQSLFTLIEQNLQAYKSQLNQKFDFNNFPLYQNTDRTQFRFIQSELQCGHIFLRVWSSKRNKDRKLQVPNEVNDYFVESVQTLLQCFISTQWSLDNQIDFTQFMIIMRSYYYTVKLYKHFDDAFLEDLINTILLKFNDLQTYTLEHLTITVIICKLMTQFTIANRKVPHHYITPLLEFLQSYRQTNSQQGVTLTECRILYYSLTACNPTHLKAIEYSLQIFQSYCELSSHAGNVVDKQFTETPEALDAMFRLPLILGQSVLKKSENIRQAEEMIQAGIMWRVVHLITLFGHFVDQDPEDKKNLIKKMLVQFAFSLRNILYLSQEDIHFSQRNIILGAQEDKTLHDFKESIQTLFVEAFIETLLEDVKQLSRFNDEDKTAVGRFLLKVAGDVQQPNHVWNEQTRKDLRQVLNRQLSQPNVKGGFKFKNKEKKQDGSYLSQLTDSPRVDLPNGFLLKVTTTMLDTTNIQTIEESANTIELILKENPSLISSLYNNLEGLHKLLVFLPNHIKDQPEVYFKIMKSIYAILTHIMNDNQGVELMRQQKALIMKLIQLARFAAKDHQFLLQDFLYFIPKIYNFNDYKSVQDLVVLGCVGMLFESILKVEQISLEVRQESFTLFRMCIKNEYELSKDDTIKSRDENQLETFRLIQLLPSHLCQLYMSDQDEDTILDNFYKEWSTPTLLWTTRMMKETLLLVLQYNNSNLANTQTQYLKINQLLHPIHTEIRNEVLIDQVILKEFNQSPQWPLPITLVNLLLEISLACDSLFQQHTTFLKKQNTTLLERKCFDRLCCALLTYLTSFQFALEQQFYNQNHPEFQEINEELIGDRLQEELQKQRDRIPESIIHQLPQWCEHLQDQKVHAHIRASILQILFIFCDSDLALALQKDQFYTTVFSVLEHVFIIKDVQYSKPQQNLLLTIMHKIIVKPFVRSLLTGAQLTTILKTYNMFITDEESLDKTSILLAIINYIINDETKREELIQLLNEISPLSYYLLLDLQGKRPTALKNLWRSDFSSDIQQQISEELEDQPLIFPTLSSFACQPLPHIHDQILQRQAEEDSLYQQYNDQLNSVNFEFSSLDYETLVIDQIVYGQPQQFTNEGQMVNKKQKYSMVSNEDIFS